MDLVTNPLFFILVLVVSFFYYRRHKSISDKNAFALGEAFEGYVQDVLFPKHNFVLVDKTHNYAENSHRYVESSLKPDFTFRTKHGGQSFHVEAKYRSRYYNDVVWCKPYQLERYKQIDKHTTVYIAIGLGGTPNEPQYVYVIPVSKLDYNTFQPSFFWNYKHRTGYQLREIDISIADAGGHVPRAPRNFSAFSGTKTDMK